MAEKHRTLSLARRGFDFETFMWVFVRLSALAMYLCAFIGLAGALIMGARTQMNLADVIRWTFMPNPNHILNTSVPDLAPWSTVFWKVMGSIFVVFATTHGLHGLLSVIEDYLTRPGLRRALRIIVILIMLLMSGIGIYMILTA
jgi:succinate dehydrogenase / fumarate reductase, membrane anchor subunit